MPARIYVLSGGPGSGKTELLNMIRSDETLLPIIPPKYSDRLQRDPFDDIITVSSSDDFNEEQYTFVYSMNNKIYGFKAEDIINCLKQGRNVFFIMSDIRVIDEIKKYFGAYVSVVYVFRNMTDEEFDSILDERDAKGREEKQAIADDTERKIRKNRLYLIQRQYVENISLFDHVILNRKDKSSEMLVQVQNIVSANNNNTMTIRPKGPVIFMIAAASGAGKRTLMQAMFSLGKKSIKVIIKATDRDAQDDDGPEIEPSKEIYPEEYDINYEFNNNKYGIKSADIWHNLATGHPQILITNMDQFERLKNIFGSAAVGVYLHATRTREEILELQSKKMNSLQKALSKVQKMEAIHQGYINNIHGFSHVLLNTIEKEDLWEQMFRLIKFYQN